MMKRKVCIYGDLLHVSGLYLKATSTGAATSTDAAAAATGNPGCCADCEPADELDAGWSVG